MKTSDLKSTPRHSSLKPAQGQSLSEYSLCLGLVALACIAGVASLGGEVHKSLNASLQTQSTSLQPATVPQGGSMPALDPPVVSSGTVTKLAKAPTGTQSLCLDGYCFQLPIIDGLNEKIDLSGTNGTEKINGFVKVLEQIASQMEQDPNADPGLAARIKALALAGHDMGFYQGQMGTRTGLNTPQHMGMGEHYGTLQHAFNQQRHQLEAYLTEHPQSTSSGVKELLQQQAEQIARVGVDINVRVGGKASFQFFMSANSKLTHQSANTICRSGAKGCHVPLENSQQDISTGSLPEEPQLQKVDRNP